MYGFTLVSGYLFCFLKVEKKRYQKFDKFILNKSKRLLVPYTVICVCWVAPIMVYFYKLGLNEIIYRFLLGSSPGQLWFLLMLFWVFIIGWLLSKQIISSVAYSVIASLAIYFVGIVGNKLLPNIWMIWTACSYFPCFVLGMRVRVRPIHVSPIVLVLLQIVLFSCSQMIDSIGVMWTVIGYSIDFILHLVGALMAWSVLQSVGNSVKWKDNKAISTLAKNSMPMYLFHQQIIYFTIAWLNGKIDPYLHAGINFIVALTCSYLISIMLMRWKVTRLLIGEKV